MLKISLLTLSLTLIAIWVESSPIKLIFEDLDTDLTSSEDLYDVEEEDLDEFSKLLDDADEKSSSNSKAGSKVNTKGYKKKDTVNKGVQNKHNIQDLKKFFKLAGAKDRGSYDDGDVYAVSDALAANVAGTKADETRKYKKGSKTRGFHRIHHKDEYKKDRVFYEDDQTQGSIKKVDGTGVALRTAAGAGVHKGYFQHDRQEGAYGKQGYFDKGFLDKEFKGFSDAQGFDGSFSSSTR
ncbi:hypothetical protein EVAR_31854_1 [Eumeta japonica]|uniref:Uncharacterized protein n=1 Tax=Eumeta variegata TaxID=151549 RepID=A0A4C1Z7H3_EUMVA|nr:hypothetical protein EVAR_31854_1 [Eumeta japonica]